MIGREASEVSLRKYAPASYAAVRTIGSASMSFRAPRARVMSAGIQVVRAV